MNSGDAAVKQGVEVQASWKAIRHSKTAFTIKELVGLSSDFSKHRQDGSKRTSGCTARVLRTERSKFLMVYNVTCTEKDSNPAGHTVRLKFDFKRLKESGKASDLDVRVSCSCVAPDTWVRMADGTEKMIKDVRPGDMVITHKGRARRVTHVTSRPAKPGEVAYRLKAEGYGEPLILSEDHPVAVVRGHEVCACGCGTPLCLSYQGRGTVRGRWGRKWAPGHHMSRRQGRLTDDHADGRALWRKPPELIDGEQLYFPKIQWAGQTAVDPDWASLVGYYLAEGSLQRVKAKCPELSKVAAQVEIDGKLNYLYGVSFALNQNEEHTLATDIVTKVTKLFPEAGIILRKHKTQGGMSVEVRSAEFAEQVYRLVGHGSLTKKLSDEVLSWGLPSLQELAASWALGDGHCGVTSQKVNTSSRALATQMSTVLLALGVWHGLSHEDPKVKNAARKYDLRWDYRRAPLLVHTMRSRMRPHDAARVDAHLASTHERRESGEWSEGFIRRADSLTRVDAPDEFFDLTVEEDSSFIANGVLVHNCPAFLFYGAQWNLSTGDALYGAPRPKFQPPTEPRRYQYVVCKHVQLVADRVAPLVERMLEAYRTPEDDAEERERQKQVEVVKQRTQLDVDKKEDELKGKEEAPAVEEKPPRKPITPKTEEPTDDLDAMPEDLTTLGLPPKPAEPAQGPKRKPITPKEPVEPEKPVVPQTEPEPGPTKPEEQAPAPKKRRPGPRPKQRREEWPSNIKLVDDEDQETTVLPGSKARPMVRDEDWRDAEFFPKAEDVPPASKARRMVEPKKAPGKPKLPPNIQLIDDDSDDYVTKINRLKQAGLLLATAEV